MEYKRQNFTAYRHLIRDSLEIFSKSLDPEKTRDLLLGYEVSASKEVEENLVESFTIERAVPRPVITIIFHNRKLPIEVYSAIIFPRKVQKGQTNLLYGWWVNTMYSFTFNSHWRRKKRSLTRRLGKPTETKDFIYWEDREKIVVYFTLLENETHSKEIVMIIYDKKYFSNQGIFDDVMKMKGASQETPSA